MAATIGAFLVYSPLDRTRPPARRGLVLAASSGTRGCISEGVPLLGRIPFDVRLAVNADHGRPLVLGDPTGAIAYEFARIGVTVRARLAARDQPSERKAAG